MNADPTAAVYDSLPLGVAVIDSSLRVKRWNAALAQWSGVPPERAEGSTLLELFPRFRHDRFGRRLDSVFRHGQSVVLSPSLHDQFLPLRTPGGAPIAHRTHARPAPDEPGAALLVLEDVTPTLAQLESLRAERRRLQESERSLRKQRQELEAKNAAIAEARRRAEDANRAKSAFLANMSHEIRTPLTAINGFAAVAADHLPEGEIARDAADRVLRNGEHLLGLVNDVLDLSKIEAGRLVLTPIACSPGRIAEEAGDMLRGRAEAKGLSLTIRAGENTPSMIQADPVRLRQVLLNLLGNAIKFTNQGSVELVINAANGGPAGGGEPRKVRFRISDTGIGIPADRLEAVFEPFTQADDSMQRAAGGTGLGLSLSRSLVEQMGGRLTVCSEESVGSTFSVSIPCGQVNSSSERPHGEDRSKPPVTARPNPLAGVRVLVAEDGPDNQVLIRYLLGRAGAAVTLVENGKLAVEAYDAAPAAHDVLLLDMQMPVMDGYGAATALRERGCEKPVVALTAHAMDGDRQRALDAGCNAYAAKPINAPELIELLA
ncbi:MAG: ATP-binding protein, partial [Planctomycetota bacterium]